MHLPSVQSGCLLCCDPAHLSTLTHLHIIEARNQIMLELRLIFYSILMRQTKADKQTPTPTPTQQKQLWHTHADTPTHADTCPSALGPWAECLRFVYGPYIPSDRVLQIRVKHVAVASAASTRWLGTNYSNDGTRGSATGLGRCRLSSPSSSSPSSSSLWETFWILQHKSISFQPSASHVSTCVLYSHPCVCVSCHWLTLEVKFFALHFLLFAVVHWYASATWLDNSHRCHWHFIIFSVPVAAPASASAAVSASVPVPVPAPAPAPASAPFSVSTSNELVCAFAPSLRFRNDAALASPVNSSS